MIQGSYAWRGGREAMLKMGPDKVPAVLVLPPLFEEANRTRRILVEVMRGLAERGVATVLPDLPGTGDSVVQNVEARFEHWQAALADLAEALPRPLASVAVRGGTLIDGVADHRWRLAPVTGRSLLRDLIRATALTGDVKASALEVEASLGPTRLGGSILHPDLFKALEAAAPVGDGHVAELAGAPWRRAEPGDDADLVAAMVAEIAAWRATCAAR